MRVKELIADTVWTPGRDYGRKPAISVLMPTFRRARSGLFLKAANSILQQSMDDLELILIDDASTDGTADLIRKLMEKDGRVSVLTHPKNVGLPAVSEYEAFLKAKADRFGFAFDDFVYETDAFERLLSFADKHPDAAVHGHISWTDRNGKDDHVLGRDVHGYDQLFIGNVIGNAAVVLSRDIVEDVGLYDPHVAMSRVCDHDLWRRVHRKRRWLEAPVRAGHEHGSGRDDSLGATHPLHFEVVQEFMNTERDQLLTPGAFPDREVWSFDSGVSAPMRLHAVEAQTFYKAKPWATELAPEPLESDAAVRRPMIGVYGHRDPTTALCFDGLPPELRRQLTFIHPAISMVEQQLMMMRCDAVIFVRHLYRRPWDEAAEFCRAMKIDCWWLTDDNFALLADELEELKPYGDLKQVRKDLKGFAGVLASSPLLIQWLKKNRLHERVEPFSAIRDAVQQARLDGFPHRRTQKKRVLRVGAFGGDFRKGQLVEAVIPALDRLGVPVELYVRGEAKDYAGLAKNVTFRSGGLTDSFGDFLSKWRMFDLDVAVHPGGKSKNVDYKTANALLISRYLGAAPIVTAEKAYEGLGEGDGLTRSDGSVEGWIKAFKTLLNGDERGRRLERLDAYCRRAFDPAGNAATFEALLAGTRTVDLFALDHRRRALLLQGPETNANSREAAARAAWQEGAIASWNELIPQLLQARAELEALRAHRLVESPVAPPADLDAIKEQAAQVGWQIGARAAYDELSPQLQAARDDAAEARHQGRLEAYAELSAQMERTRIELERALREERARASAQIALARAEAAAEALRAAGVSDPFGEPVGSA